VAPAATMPAIAAVTPAAYKRRAFILRIKKIE